MEGTIIERISPWSSYVLQDTNSKIYESVFWHPTVPYKLKQSRPKKPQSLRIYESHIGISCENYGIATYLHFKENLLPYIKDTGYYFI